MLESEKFAIAAHLHVHLRRINGRVTDVEWMVKSPDYAREIIRVARTETHPDLLRLADKLEAALQPPMPTPRVQAVPPARPAFVASQSGPASGFPTPGADSAALRKRYVGTLR
ncbi:MAG: hypothetical protein Q7V20_10075 [Aquabacterium sp.]|nr:hypothetical protein [Aquabacterium sp.]MDO9003787.1 hypothetical protein [Aquabacterium sp.]